MKTVTAQAKRNISTKLMPVPFVAEPILEILPFFYPPLPTKKKILLSAELFGLV
jgi:hypothetical protein